MKYLKILGLTAVAAMAMMAFAVGSASATTLEETGVTQNGAVTITASAEGSIKLQPTGGGSLSNTCTVSHVHGTTTTFTGHEVEGTLEVLTFEKCANEKVEVIKPGKLDITWISGTTNGTVKSTSAEVKVPSPLGKLTCTTPAAGVDIGTLTGVASGNATMDINAVLNCGIFLPSAEWAGTYEVTSPHGLGVSS